MQIGGFTKTDFSFFPARSKKKRDESPSPPGCKYLVPFPSPQNAPNPPLPSSEFYAFSSKHCGNSQKALHLPGGRTGISGIFLIYIVGQKTAGAYCVCIPATGRHSYFRSTARSTTPALRLRRHVQHVFNENAVAGGGIAHKDMSNGTYQFPVLYNR